MIDRNCIGIGSNASGGATENELSANQAGRPPRSGQVTWQDLLKAGIPVPPYRVVTTLADALAFRAEIKRGNVCLKAVTGMHKARAGLVELNLTTRAETSRAWARITARCAELNIEPTLLVQRQAPAGLELIVGARRDDTFGPIVLLGLGGSIAEHLDRSELRLCPVTTGDALEMLNSLLGQRIPEVAEIVVAVSRLIEERPTLLELDLNPVIVGPQGPVVVDLRSVAGEVRARNHYVPLAQQAIGHMMSPRSVAIIGASADSRKVGGHVLANLRQYFPRLQIFPVNPRGGKILGIPVMKSIDEVPIAADVAVIAVEATLVPDALGSCGARGIKAAIVVSGGFGEAGDHEAEGRVRDVARRQGIRVCGVNTIGVIGDVPLTFSRASEGQAVNGGVSFLTQSGALGGSLLLRCWAIGLGTARYICVGNQTDLEMADFLEFLANDRSTTTIGIFVEGISDGPRFREALQLVLSVGKQIAVMRAGTTLIGRTAALSHTGTLGGTPKIYDQVFRDVPAAADLPELVAICQGLEWLPRSAGSRVGILSTSGGACSVLADFATQHGLHLPELDAATQKAVRAVLPTFATTRNPVDTTGQVTVNPRLFGRAAQIMLASDRIDALLIAITTLTGETAESVALDISQLRSESRKPIVVAWSLPESVVPSSFAILRAARIPVFDSFSLSVAALSAAMRQRSIESRVDAVQS